MINYDGFSSSEEISGRSNFAPLDRGPILVKPAPNSLGREYGPVDGVTIG